MENFDSHSGSVCTLIYTSMTKSTGIEIIEITSENVKKYTLSQCLLTYFTVDFMAN